MCARPQPHVKLSAGFIHVQVASLEHAKWALKEGEDSAMPKAYQGGLARMGGGDQADGLADHLEDYSGQS